MTRQEKKKIADPKIVTDAIEVADDAGLRYVSHDQPGYTRKAKGDDFDYFDTEGKPIRDEQRLLPIKRLAIPPAYTDVLNLDASEDAAVTGQRTRVPMVQRQPGFLGLACFILIVGPTSWLSELNYFVQAAAVWNIGTTGARLR